jgi:hypothetical protein
MNISRLQKVPLRELWKHEAHGFTHWLAENLDLLSETVGFALTFIKREASAGPFSADILAEDPDGNSVIIENQLEQTNHDHLGKIVTYLSNLDAKTAIWITSDPRPEHEKAIHWLNEMLPVDTAFFLIKLEAFQIDNSAPAPMFTIVAGPSPESKEVGDKKKELAERHVMRLEFWKQLLEQAKINTPIFANRSPTKDNWISVSAGKSGFSYGYVIRMEDAQVEFYIDHGSAEKNKSIFEKILSQREQIENSFGRPLDWQKLDNKQACRVRYVFAGGGLTDKEKWPEIQMQMIDGMVNLQKAIQPVINQMK